MLQNSGLSGFFCFPFCLNKLDTQELTVQWYLSYTFLICMLIWNYIEIFLLSLLTELQIYALMNYFFWFVCYCKSSLTKHRNEVLGVQPMFTLKLLSLTQRMRGSPEKVERKHRWWLNALEPEFYQRVNSRTAPASHRKWKNS